MGVDMDEDIVDNVEGAGEDPGGVVIEDADTDGDADVDADGDNEWALVAVEDMGVEDGDREHEHEQARVAVDAEAEDDVAEDVEHVLIIQGAGPITYCSKKGS